ncbi:M48 family metallopeptidase [Alistipes sp. OttesenSCG-928-B03]|nr:M48 family metallopeptidase [Alistipes sp. OttesenSCG-928-B03]
MLLFGRKNKQDGQRERTVQAKKPTGSTKRQFTHPELGEITVCRNARARRIIVSVKRDSTLRLTLPSRASADEGLRFLESKRDWIAAAQQRTRTRNRPQVILPPYPTRHHTLHLAPAEVAKITVRIGDGRITVTHPAGISPEDEHVQAAIKKGIEEAWRAEAKALLPRRTAELAAQLGLQCNNVTVRNTVSKWGSCSPANDISLSLHLMRLPDHLIDYVIVHELCHTVHKNHGPRFHELLDRLTSGRHAAMRKELRGYNTRW